MILCHFFSLYFDLYLIIPKMGHRRMFTATFDHFGGTDYSYTETF